MLYGFSVEVPLPQSLDVVYGSASPWLLPQLALLDPTIRACSDVFRFVMPLLLPHCLRI